MWVQLAIGSVAGGFSRFVLTGAINKLTQSPFPFGTIVVNGLGCFLMGFFLVVADHKLLLPMNTRILLLTGFCGAFTTFSTFILETFLLFQQGEILKAGLNIGVSLTAGFLFFLAGSFLARTF